MEAPKRKCCGERHWESEWECPNKEEGDKADFTVVEQPKPVNVVPKPSAAPKITATRGRKPEPFVFDPELDRPDSTATDASKRQMRARRKKPQQYRDYMRNYMAIYRKRKIKERQEREERESKEELT